MSSNDFFDARERMLVRIAQTRDASGHGLPHWARAEDGNWTLTPDGDWTGGAFVGELWLAHLADPQRFQISDAHAALARMLPRVNSRRHSRAFGFYHGAAVGSILFGDEVARDAALTAATSLGKCLTRIGLDPARPGCRGG